MRSLWPLALLAMSAAAIPSVALPTPVVSITNFGPRNHHKLTRRSRYEPHQGTREKARRVRQMTEAA